MPPMRIEVVADERALADAAVGILAEVVRAAKSGTRRSQVIVGLPTGKTPERMYAEVVRFTARGEIDLRGVRAFAVDEFIDVSARARGTNAEYFAAVHVHDVFLSLDVPYASATDPQHEIATFASRIASEGGLDLCLLGIGTNGHIAFNEPGSAIDSRARVVELTEESRRAHAAAFGSLDAVPRRGVTLGVADILESKAILVMAQGKAKAAIVARAIEGPQTRDVPASWLRSHANVTWLLDEAAASQLSDDARRVAQPPPTV
jgi:glucosamine-6-phosphate deaminase